MSNRIILTHSLKRSCFVWICLVAALFATKAQAQLSVDFNVAVTEVGGLFQYDYTLDAAVTEPRVIQVR